MSAYADAPFTIVAKMNSVEDGAEHVGKAAGNYLRTALSKTAI